MVTTSILLTEQEQAILQIIAQQAGTTQEDLLRSAVQRMIAEFKSLNTAYPLPQRRSNRQQRTEAAKQQARERFEHHFGTLNLEDATGADNEQIDADLAQAYLAAHEEN